MKQQILAMLDKKIERYYGSFLENERSVLQELRAEVEKMDSGWISCLERIPKEDHVYVLGANSKTKFVGEMNWESDYGFSHHTMPGQTITHWQYLPPSPNL